MTFITFNSISFKKRDFSFFPCEFFPKDANIMKINLKQGNGMSKTTFIETPVESFFPFC